MNQRQAIAGGLGLLCAFSAATADISITRPDTGHIYTIIDGITDWQTGRTLAQQLGGYMVSITDAAENAWVVDNVFIPHVRPRGVQLWLGATDEINEGTWLWDSGEPFAYSNWAPGEPNNNTVTGPPGGGGEDYASMWDLPTGTWNDYPSPFIYITGANPINGVVVVETVPAPTSGVLFGSVCVVAMWRRKRS